MKDIDIATESQTIIIKTKESLRKCEAKINTAFKFFDQAIGAALYYRESFGWGTEGFIEYLKHRYSRTWQIDEIVSDTYITLEGV